MGEGDAELACQNVTNPQETYWSFSLALWEIDTSFQLVNATVEKFHSHIAFRDGITFLGPFQYETELADEPPLVRGQFYGMSFFARATGHYSRIVPVDVKVADEMVKVWLTHGDDSVLRLSVIHKNLSATTNAHIVFTVTSDMLSARVADPNARLYVLTVPSTRTPRQRALAWQAISLFGRTWDGTHDGNPAGSETYTTITDRTGRGQYEFDVEPITAVMLEIDITNTESQTTVSLLTQ